MGRQDAGRPGRCGAVGGRAKGRGSVARVRRRRQLRRLRRDDGVGADA